jgi:hypothetical protein
MFLPAGPAVFRERVKFKDLRAGEFENGEVHWGTPVLRSVSAESKPKYSEQREVGSLRRLLRRPDVDYHDRDVIGL